MLLISHALLAKFDLKKSAGSGFITLTNINKVGPSKAHRKEKQYAGKIPLVTPSEHLQIHCQNEVHQYGVTVIPHHVCQKSHRRVLYTTLHSPALYISTEDRNDRPDSQCSPGPMGRASCLQESLHRIALMPPLGEAALQMQHILEASLQ